MFEFIYKTVYSSVAINSRMSCSQNTNLDIELRQTFKEKCERLKRRKY